MLSGNNLLHAVDPEGSIVVEKRNHLSEGALVVLRKPASGREVIGVEEGAEHAIPPSDICEVELVNVELMMYGMVQGMGLSESS